MWIVLFALMQAQVACPATIQVSQRVMTPPAGWSVDATTTQTHKLSGATLYDGPPKEQASLVPDSRLPDKSTWLLRPNPRGYYLECRYGEVALSRRIANELKQCELVETKEIRVQCR